MKWWSDGKKLYRMKRKREWCDEKHCKIREMLIEYENTEIMMGNGDGILGKQWRNNGKVVRRK